MRNAFLMGMTAVVIGLVGCGSDDVTVGGGGSTTTTTITGQGGAGGEGTTTTTSSTTTTTTGQGGNGGGGSCASMGDDCTNCLYAQCNQTYCGCFDNPECALLVQCLMGCQQGGQGGQGGQSCQETCMSQHPEGLTDALLASDCTAANCDAECPGVGQDLPPCQECLLTNCGPQMEQCFSNPECTALIQCAQACAPGDQACITACGQAHLGGLQDAQGVLQCAQSPTCSAQCT